MKERFFHIEFFREGDDYIAIEYNNRPAVVLQLMSITLLILLTSIV